MRIISGKFKGKRLLENKFDHIRPTADMVKQALFTKLQFEIKDSRVLDLFCGTGSLGIEALSRGAREVCFVDKAFKSVKSTRENLKLIGVESLVFQGDALKILERFEGKFDIILIDPPYESGVYDEVLNKIFECGLIEDGGVVVCESLKNEKIECLNFEKVDEKFYGIKKLTYFENLND